MYEDGLFTFGEGDNRKIYAFDKSGRMVTDSWYSDTWYYTTDGGKKVYVTDWAYLGADGAAKTGWFQDKGIWYYADKYGWLYIDTWLVTDDNYVYHFDESGAMTTGWFQVDDVWLYFKDSGELTFNEWIKYGDTWYYLKEDAVMAANETVTINGTDYKFSASGAWIE